MSKHHLPSDATTTSSPKRQRLALDASPDFEHHLLEHRESILSLLTHRDWAAMTRVNKSWCGVCQDPELWSSRTPGFGFGINHTLRELRRLSTAYTIPNYQSGAVDEVVISNWGQDRWWLEKLPLCKNLKVIHFYSMTTDGSYGSHTKLFNSLPRGRGITLRTYDYGIIKKLTNNRHCIHGLDILGHLFNPGIFGDVYPNIRAVRCSQQARHIDAFPSLEFLHVKPLFMRTKVAAIDAPFDYVGKIKTLILDNVDDLFQLSHIFLRSVVHWRCVITHLNDLESEISRLHA